MSASMTSSCFRFVLAAALITLAACDGGPTPPPDAGRDAAASAPDAATADGGPRDAGSDAGAPATMDGGATDAGEVVSDAGADGGDTVDAGSDATVGDGGSDGGALDDAGEDGGPTTSGCGSNADCADTELCRKPIGVCGGDGICEARPFFCSFVYLPVCGCDGMTYSNECNARAAGVSVDRDGECAAAPNCASNGDCATAQFCYRAAGDCGAPGTCEDRPLFCGGIFLQVCGCDGVTYDNECNAHAAGTTVAVEGPCGG